MSVHEVTTRTKQGAYSAETLMEMKTAVAAHYSSSRQSIRQVQASLTGTKHVRA
jgi:hypothetical protein